MVELLDGTVIAQLGVPDMGLPIQYALTYPERKPSRSDRLDFTAYPGGLHFYAPDFEALPCLALAMQCARTGGTAPTVMNAANEVAVHLFLDHKIGYHSIYESVAAAVDAIAPAAAPDLDVIRAADQEAARSSGHISISERTPACIFCSQFSSLGSSSPCTSSATSLWLRRAGACG